MQQSPTLATKTYFHLGDYKYRQETLTILAGKK